MYSTIAETDTQTLGTFDMFVDNARGLPVNRVVAAASAALGGFIYTAAGRGELEAVVKVLLDQKVTNVASRFPVWAAISTRDPFEAAETIVSPIIGGYAETTVETNGQLASNGVLPLVDGGYTDTCGIGHAVSVGATTVTAFCSLSNLQLLFSSAKQDIRTFATYFQAGFVPTNSFPIFDFEDTNYGGFGSAQAYAEHQVKTRFVRVGVDPLKFSANITVGTINVITKSNLWFGIEGAKKVILNIISGGTAPVLGVGAFENFADFSVGLETIVDDLASAMGTSSEGTRMLQSWFSP
ncbi:unnamed protein product [Polarella glacialis]|uniref:Uncharacterized protein n=1 Tax=Polarella glacialis TaxID=89957 RepID=A0A813JLK9_POLGL|nr:unnamed protein product [Polarella glacialis]